MKPAYERLFFALWPDDDVRQQLIEQYQQLTQLQGQGRRPVHANLHMTLHFLGNIALKDIDCFIQQASKVQGSGFEMQLNQIGFFEKPKVQWVGGDDLPSALYALQSALGEQIESCSFKPEARKYNPHVTMARKVHRPVEYHRIKPVLWKVNRFVLVQSIVLDESVKYQVRNSFQLS